MKRYHVATLAAGSVLLALGLVAAVADRQATCPVSGKAFAATNKTITLTVNGQKQEFCCAGCPPAFVKDPGKYIKATMNCPVMTSSKVDPSKAPRVAINDQLILVCCGGCPEAVTKNPSKYIKELKDPVSSQAFKLTASAPHSMYKGVHYFFSSEDNKKAFDADSEKFSNKMLSKST